jgi:transglutaminase-like putative cysteine protease
MKYAASHVTTYEYDDPVSLCHSQAHLQPRPTGCQRILHWEMLVQPPPDISANHLDYYQNPVHAFTIQTPHRRLTIASHSLIEVMVPADQASARPPDRPWEEARDLARSPRSPQGLEACPYTFDSPLIRATPALRQYAAPSFTPGRPLHEALLDLTARIHDQFAYDSRATDVSTPLEQVLAMRRGVCQDFAHLQVGCCRAMGLAARYVSGYLLTQPAPGQPRLVGADASHAWASVFCPDLGWVDFDPTNNLKPCDQHITVAWGRDYNDVCPVRGIVLGGGKHQLEVKVDVVPAPSD